MLLSPSKCLRSVASALSARSLCHAQPRHGQPGNQPKQNTSSEPNEASREDDSDMSLSFVTRKLRTQTLVEAEKDSAAADDDDVDEATAETEDAAKIGGRRLRPRRTANLTEADSDDGDAEADMEDPTDEDEDEDEVGQQFKKGCRKRKGLVTTTEMAPEEAAATAPSDDNFSSEEELKDIISEQRKKKQRSPFAEDVTAAEAESNSSSASGVGAEKRKWCEAHAEKRRHLQLCAARAGSGSGDEEVSRLLLQHRSPSSASPSSASSSTSSSAVSFRACPSTPTPVQFCTSPPLDVHRPKRSQSPPPKLFHMEAAAAKAHNGENQGCSCAPSAPAAACLSADDEDSRPSSSTTERAAKRHRSKTPRPHNLQRPCLDFEKMQQIKRRVVTSWRPQGTELSLFCW